MVCLLPNMTVVLSIACLCAAAMLLLVHRQVCLPRMLVLTQSICLCIEYVLISQVD